MIQDLGSRQGQSLELSGGGSSESTALLDCDLEERMGEAITHPRTHTWGCRFPLLSSWKAAKLLSIKFAVAGFPGITGRVERGEVVGFWREEERT